MSSFYVESSASENHKHCNELKSKETKKNIPLEKKFILKINSVELKLLWKMSSNFINQNLVLLVIVACKFGFEFNFNQ